MDEGAAYVAFIHPSMATELGMKFRMQDSDLVEAAWSKMTIVPELTEIEATRAAQRLWRARFGGTSPSVVAGRKTYIDVGTARITVCLRDGWQQLLHQLAIEFEPYEGVKWKRATAAQLELKFVHEAFKRGWLRGALRPPEERKLSTKEKQKQAYERVLAGIVRWTVKETRARKAISKLKKKAKYYERVLNEVAG